MKLLTSTFHAMGKWFATEISNMNHLVHVDNLLNNPGDVLAYTWNINRLYHIAAPLRRIHSWTSLLNVDTTLCYQTLQVTFAWLSQNYVETQNSNNRKIKITAISQLLSWKPAAYTVSFIWTWALWLVFVVLLWNASVFIIFTSYSCRETNEDFVGFLWQVALCCTYGVKSILR